MNSIRKFLTSVGGLVAIALQTGLVTHLSGIWPTVTAAVTALLVYLVPNAKTKPIPTPVPPTPPGAYKP